MRNEMVSICECFCNRKCDDPYFSRYDYFNCLQRIQ